MQSMQLNRQSASPTSFPTARSSAPQLGFMSTPPLKQSVDFSGGGSHSGGGADSGSFDYPAMEDLDPGLVDGYQLFYEREVPFELRSATSLDVPTEVGALEAIRVRVLVRGEQNRAQAVRVEVTSESNLFFHYTHDMDEATFRDVQDAQRLMVDFKDYPTVLMRMLNQCVREPHVYLAVYVMQHTGEARLDFIQNMEYKFVELLSCKFAASAEDVVRAQVTYRYNVVKARLALLQSRLSDVNALVKVKNPSLLLQLQRTPPRVPGIGTSPQKDSNRASKVFYS